MKRILVSAVCLTIAAALPACNTSVGRGEIYIGGVGEKYVTGQLNGGQIGITLTNTSMTVQHNYRGYIADKCEGAYEQDMFTEMMVLGKSLRFTMDVSRLSCGCNAALYLVAMPAAAPGQGGDYYCDANDVGGNWCTEMDLIEANSVGAATTAHYCNGTASCDKWGCGTNYRTQGYGPNGANIDTNHPFNLTYTFHELNGVLSGISSSLTQDGKPGISTPEICSLGQEYLQRMSASLKQGMVLVYTLWGTTMTWLDGCDPSKTCDTSGTVTFSDISIF